MILVKERFLSANHIQHIYIEAINERQHAVIVQMSGAAAVFGRRTSDAMTKEMAFELRRRIVKAIVDYKSSDKSSVQHVDFPTYQEVHPERESAE